MVSIEEYRKLMRDQKSSSERIQQHIGFLESFCRNIIRLELKKYRKE